jgi:hypothetical protein
MPIIPIRGRLPDKLGPASTTAADAEHLKAVIADIALKTATLGGAGLARGALAATQPDGDFLPILAIDGVDGPRQYLLPDLIGSDFDHEQCLCGQIPALIIASGAQSAALIALGWASTTTLDANSEPTTCAADAQSLREAVAVNAQAAGGEFAVARSEVVRRDGAAPRAGVFECTSAPFDAGPFVGAIPYWMDWAFRYLRVNGDERRTHDDGAALARVATDFVAWVEGVINAPEHEVCPCGSGQLAANCCAARYRDCVAGGPGGAAG